jgi:hypothetical protein
MPDKNLGKVQKPHNTDASQKPPKQPRALNIKRSEKDERATSATSGNPLPKTKPEHWADRVQAICTIAIVFITLFYAWEALRQADASEEAIKSTKTSLQIDQRAWVDVIILQGWPSKHNKSKEIRVVWKNFGKSVATDVSLIVFADSCEGDLPKSIFDYDTEKALGFGAMPPNSVWTEVIKRQHDCKTGAASDLLSDFNYRQLVKAGKKVVIHGRLNYIDMFGKPHWRTFCNVSTSQLDEFTACTYPAGQEGNNHNKTDKTDQDK